MTGQRSTSYWVNHWAQAWRMPARARSCPSQVRCDPPRRSPISGVKLTDTAGRVREVDSTNATGGPHPTRGRGAAPRGAGEGAGRGPAEAGAKIEAGGPGRPRRRRPARRPAGGAGVIPGVVGDTEEVVVGLDVARPARHVGLPEDN